MQQHVRTDVFNWIKWHMRKQITMKCDLHIYLVISQNEKKKKYCNETYVSQRVKYVIGQKRNKNVQEAATNLLQTLLKKTIIVASY